MDYSAYYSEIEQLIQLEIYDMYDVLTTCHPRITYVDYEFEIGSYGFILQMRRRSDIITIHLIDYSRKFSSWKTLHGDYGQTWSRHGPFIEDDVAGHLDISLIEQVAIWVLNRRTGL